MSKLGFETQNSGSRIGWTTFEASDLSKYFTTYVRTMARSVAPVGQPCLWCARRRRKTNFKFTVALVNAKCGRSESRKRCHGANCYSGFAGTWKCDGNAKNNVQILKIFILITI
jgi:hypothetical protein